MNFTIIEGLIDILEIKEDNIKKLADFIFKNSASHEQKLVQFIEKQFYISSFGKQIAIFKTIS
jgi:hypothetical protein